MEVGKYVCMYNEEEEEEDSGYCFDCGEMPCTCFDELSIQYQPMQTDEGIVDELEHTSWGGPRLV